MAALTCDLKPISKEISKHIGINSMPFFFLLSGTLLKQACIVPEHFKVLLQDGTFNPHILCSFVKMFNLCLSILIQNVS